MGAVEKLFGQRVYVDANIFIYIVEGFPEYQAELRTILSAIDQGSIDACTSELTIAEVLVGTIAAGNDADRRNFERLLSSPRIRLCEISRSVLVLAAELRARSKSLKLPDAIHVATALQEDCRSILTNDHLLGNIREIDVTLLGQG